MESWRDPTPAEVATIRAIEALIAAAHAEGPPPQISGHLRIAPDTGGERDVLLGARTHTAGPIAIVDWRTAPLAEAFFRHPPGTPYEIEVDARVVAGRVLAAHRLDVAGPEVIAIAD